MSRPFIVEYDSEKLKTFEEWDKDGFYVTKGETSRYRDSSGTCLFHVNQVNKRQRVSSLPNTYYMDDEDAWELSDMMGLNGYEGPGFW